MDLIALSEIALLILDGLYVLTGIMFIIVGGVLMQYHSFIELSKPEALAPIIIIIVVGGHVLISSYLGVCGTMYISPVKLRWFSCLVLLAALLQLSSGITLLVRYQEIKDDRGGMKKATYDSLAKARKDSKTLELWDNFQRNFLCCGVDGAKDWETIAEMEPPDSCYLEKKLQNAGCWRKTENNVEILFQILGHYAIWSAVFQVIQALLTVLLAKQWDKL